MSHALPLPPRPTLEQYENLAGDFQQACTSGDPGAIRRWANRWAPGDTERIEHRWRSFKVSNEGAPLCSLTSAQLFIAQEYGFVGWPNFAEHLRGLASDNSPVWVFEAAADAIAAGDAATLLRLLCDHPGLAQQRSTREHRSTLLHYVAANGVEDFRQKTPGDIVEIARLLLDAGADVNAESAAYGGGSTALNLAATSVHPERAGVQIALLQILLDAGAAIDNQTPDGKRQSIIKACLANGQPQAAEFFANLGVAVDLESSAALGRLAVVRSYFGEDGRLQHHADEHQLGPAFVYACGYGQREVVEFLLENGAGTGPYDPDGRTGLHAAAYGGHASVATVLLQRGAAVVVKERNFDATPLDVALWVWDNSLDPARRERCCEVVALLARAGAKLDPQQWSDPGENSDSNAQGMLEKIRADPRMQAALRGEIVPGQVRCTPITSRDLPPRSGPLPAS